jgi:DNA helicase-2/ATP-dependent DNA helicase PcrA
MIKIEQLAKWSEPVNGVRYAQNIRQSFWNEWRASKMNLKRQGVVVGKMDGEWVASWKVPAGYVFEEAPEVAAAPVSAPVDVNWSLEQSNIFEWFRSSRIGQEVVQNLVVRARAGTGKTTTIKAAFSFAPEATCLYAVFNKKNQLEAAAKISDPRVEIRTLHSLGLMFIKQVWPKAEPDDKVEYDRIRNAARGELPEDVFSAVCRAIGLVKNMFVAPTLDQIVELIDARGLLCDVEDELTLWSPERVAQIVLDAVNLARVKDVQGRISYDDMVWLPVAMNWVRPRFDLVVVDEAQDMNVPQLLMARGSVKAGGRMCVVGDDRQAIYGFRGAAQDGLQMMQDELQAGSLGLTTTYRCPKLVVEMAAKLVPDYNAAPEAPEGHIYARGEHDIYTQAEAGDAILSRTNAPLLPACLGLIRRGIPARIEGRDVGAMLVAIVKKLKARTIPDFIGKVTAWENRGIARALKTKDPESKVQSIKDQAATLIAAAEGLSSVAEIEARIESLFSNSGEGKPAAVVLSTVHKAKGLEWDRVWMLQNTFRQGGDDQEKNIKYVAITRSKRTLVLVGGEKTK